MNKPRVPIFSRDFKYVSSHKTDVRATWEAERKRLQQSKKVIPIMKARPE